MSEYKYYSSIYKEKENKKNPFIADEYFFYGYNINDELMKKIDFNDWIGLCFFERKLENWEKSILNKLPLIMANKGYRFQGNLSAQNSSFVKAPIQNILISFLGTSGGIYGGSKEISMLLYGIKKFGLENIYEFSKITKGKDIDNYGEITHFIGFDNHNHEEKLYIKKILDELINYEKLITVKKLHNLKDEIEKKAELKIDLNLIISCVFFDLKLSPEKSEALFLFYLMPFITALALEPNKNEKKFPFYNDIVFKEIK